MADPSPLEVLSDILLLVSVDVTPEFLGTLTARQRAEAEEWAAQVHLKASDNAYVRVPSRPDFLPVDNAAPVLLPGAQS